MVEAMEGAMEEAVVMEVAVAVEAVVVVEDNQNIYPYKNYSRLKHSFKKNPNNGFTYDTFMKTIFNAFLKGYLVNHVFF